MISCINPECGAVHSSAKLECPPGWREIEDGYVCPRERIRFIWEPKAAVDVIDEATLEYALRERKENAAKYRAEAEVREAETTRVRAAKKLERRLKQEQQQTDEMSRRFELRKEQEAENFILDQAGLVQTRLIHRGVVSKAAAKAAIEDMFKTKLTAAQKALILQAVLGGK